MGKISKCRKFSNEQDYDAFSVVRLSNKRVGQLGGRGTWVCISVERDKQTSIYRRIRGCPAFASLPLEGIELDYEGSRKLGITGQRDEAGFVSCDLRVRKARQWEVFKAHWSHPEPAYSFPVRLGVLGLGLGVVGCCLECWLC